MPKKKPGCVPGLCSNPPLGVRNERGLTAITVSIPQRTKHEDRARNALQPFSLTVALRLGEDDMSITNQALFIDKIVPFGPLEAACSGLGRRMTFTDIDMEREMHGRWIRAEWKSEGVPIPNGQRINFEQLVATQLVTVIELWGDNGIPTSYRLVGQMAAPARCTLADIGRLFTDWESWAKAQPYPRVSADGNSVTIHATAGWVWQQ